LANVISGLPCRKGDGVAVLAHNCFRYVELYFACAKAGTPIVPLNYRLSGRELTYILNHSEARALFFGQKYLPVVEEIRGDLECVAHLVCLDGEPVGIPQYEDLLRMASDAEPDVPLSEEDVAILGYTGGTTGLPKGVMTTHKNVISSCYNCAVEMRLHPDTVYLNAPPLFHAGDAMGMFAFSFAGGTNVVVDSFDPERVLRVIEGERVTHPLLVPAMILALLRYPGVKEFDLGSLQTVIYGTAPMPFDPLIRALGLFGCGFAQIYGATETFVPISILKPEDHVAEGPEDLMKRMLSAGRPMIGVEVRIVDDKGEELPTGQIGEIAVRGANVMKGYWKQPELTAEVLRDGWYLTGDMGRADELGYIYIVDRKKDMIISGGENIYPKEVEDVLFMHPAVADAAVIGVPDERWGEAVKALVIVKPGAQVTEEELIEHCKRHLASYKKPQSVEFMGEFPRSTAGKVLKNVLREKYWQGRERKV
ncbi:MAG: long-chain-fatty-acid--CoA ligase, partial [Firmicutes bacterium]|nr:long-chain-fatty-acid--CoA ligase [Bacillota bacterium]